MALRAERKVSGSPGPRVEVLQPNEQPHAPADAAGPLVVGRDPITKRVLTSEAAREMARRPRRRSMLPRAIACDPRFEAHQRSRREWLVKRRTELCDATGGVSHGVGAMLNAAAWLYAGGEFAAELAAMTGDVEMFKVAGSLTATARQHDLAAWEMACREGDARSKRRGPIDPLAGVDAKWEPTTPAPEGKP